MSTQVELREIVEDKRLLTEPQAWREIARQIAEGQWGRLGLCHEINSLRWSGRIGAFTGYAMHQRINSHLLPKHWAYPNGAEPEARILAALWLALESTEKGVA